MQCAQQGTRHPRESGGPGASAADLPPQIPAFAQGCTGKVGATLSPRNGLSRTRFSLLSPRRPGGEGRVRGADGRICGAAHLTFPGAVAPGPLPLPPEGRRGAFPRNPSRRILRFRLSWRRCCNRIRFPGRPCRFGGASVNEGCVRQAGRFQPSQSQTAWPITSSLSRPWSHGSSSVNIVTHWR